MVDEKAVERLARKMCLDNAQRPDEIVSVYPVMATARTPHGDLPVVAETMPLWHAYTRVARVAIEHIRVEDTRADNG